MPTILFITTHQVGAHSPAIHHSETATNTLQITRRWLSWVESWSRVWSGVTHTVWLQQPFSSAISWIGVSFSTTFFPFPFNEIDFVVFFISLLFLLLTSLIIIIGIAILFFLLLTDPTRVPAQKHAIIQLVCYSDHELCIVNFIMNEWMKSKWLTRAGRSRSIGQAGWRRDATRLSFMQILIKILII